MIKVFTHTRLLMALSALDEREAKRPGHNPYALALYFEAADDVHDARSFADAFTPSRGMDRVARSLGLDLSVDRGRWVLPDVVA